MNAKLLLFAACWAGLSAHSAVEPEPSAETAQYGTPYAAVPEPREVVIYQVNTRAFSPEGNFAGVAARLDAIKALGANVLYLLPTYPIGVIKTVNSPYCIRDYKGVNAEFGTLDDLRSLVEEAHKRQMIVLLDWVANHTAWDNPWIANKSWYKQDEKGEIISPPKTGWLDVAALNYDNMDMRKAMIDAMKYWVFAANIDGFRCDATDFLPADFWDQAVKELRAISSHKLLLFAEGKRSENFTAGFDLKYGMAFYNNMATRIYGTHQSVKSIDTLNASEYRGGTERQQVVRYITNHDVDNSDGAPSTVFDSKEGAVAAFLVCAYMKGVPMIYNGQEVGCPVKLSFFDRSTPIDWSLNPELASEYQRIIGLRNDSEAIRAGELKSFDSDDVCAFSKTAKEDQVAVIVNLRRTPTVFAVPEELRPIAWKDAYSGDAIELPRELDLKPYQYRVFRKR